MISFKLSLLSYVLQLTGWRGRMTASYSRASGAGWIQVTVNPHGPQKNISGLWLILQEGLALDSRIFEIV